MSRSQIDPRGPQFNAALTSVVLAVALFTAPGPVGVTLLVIQAALFALGVFAGVQRTPAAYLFKRFVRPRLDPPLALEDAAAPRFAQGVGLGFTVVALAGYLGGVTWLGIAATALALVAALLNAVLRLCLGCKLYGVCKLPQADTASSRPAASPQNITDSTTSSTTNNKEEATV